MHFRARFKLPPGWYVFFKRSFCNLFAHYLIYSPLLCSKNRKRAHRRPNKRVQRELLNTSLGSYSLPLRQMITIMCSLLALEHKYPRLLPRYALHCPTHNLLHPFLPLGLLANIFLRKKAVNHQHVTPSEVMKLSKPFETVMDMVEMERPLLTSASHLVGLASFRIIPLPFRIARLSRHYAYLSLDDKVRFTLSHPLIQE